MVDGNGSKIQATQTTFCVSQGKTVCLFYLSQMSTMVSTWFSCTPNWIELCGIHAYVYTAYIHGGVGAINLDSPLTEATGA